VLDNKKSVIGINQHETSNFKQQIEQALAQIGINGFTIQLVN
jgi:hypothetical protein